jgi:hypothetical protein
MTRSQSGFSVLRTIQFGFLLLVLTGCESAYYGAMEKVGIHKREILIDRIEDTQEAQVDAQEQFRDALEQFRSVVQFDGGDLEVLYNKLNDEYEASEAAVADISSHIDKVESVAEALFEEWQKELELYSSASLRRQSANKLASTKRQYRHLLGLMRQSEAAAKPVLNALRDNTLYLKHNLNARAIASLKNEYKGVDADVQSLIRKMQKAIDESNTFIAEMKE